MANGKYHGTRKGHGIRINNPLSLSVWVVISDGTGWDLTRTLKPGQEVYVTVPHLGEYEVKPKVLRFEETGTSKILGDASFEVTPTPPKQARKLSKTGPVFITEARNVKDRRMRTVAEWRVLKGFEGLLKAINIELSGDCEAEVILPNGYSKKVRSDETLTWPSPVQIHSGSSGAAVVVKAGSIVGNSGSIRVIIQGELHALPTPQDATQVTRSGTLPLEPREEPEETPLRSLGDLMEEMRKREEVKV